MTGGWLTPHGADEEIWARRRWISAAAGVSVAYVFVDVLPELAAHNRAVVAAAAGERMFFAYSVAGGVVITSLRAGLPDQPQRRFWYFVVGA